MSNRAKKISELTTATSLTDNDYFILVANVAGTLTTRKLTVSSFRDTVTFPHYGNSTYAGIVKVGSQLAVDNDGLLSANIRQANTSAYGTVKIGSELAIDQNGFLVANIAVASNNHTGIVAVGNNLTINSTGYLSANIFIANTTVLGKVGVGNQLSINATGFLSANINHANTTSEGVVKVGNNLSINVSGHLSAVLPLANTTSPGMVIAGNSLAILNDGTLNLNLVFANTSNPGVFVVGDQLSINEFGQLSANINIANTSSAGIIKVGDNMVIDANGFLTANVAAASVGSASQLESNGFILSIDSSNGEITLPGNISQIQLSGGNTKIYSNGYVSIESNDGGSIYLGRVGVYNDRAFIYVKDNSEDRNWLFAQDGTTTIPANLQSTLTSGIVLGNSTIYTTVNATAITTTSSNSGISLVWANTTSSSNVTVSNTGVKFNTPSGNVGIDANGAIIFGGNINEKQTVAFKWVAPPGAADATGIAGQMASDGNYLYYCVDDGVWKRTPLDTWL